jgi:hypothetical protein
MGVASAATLAIPLATSAQVMPTSDDIEKELGHPMPDEARKLLKAALEANRKNASDRLKTRLPDCSEPCFIYHPTGVRK